MEDVERMTRLTTMQENDVEGWLNSFGNVFECVPPEIRLEVFRRLRRDLLVLMREERDGVPTYQMDAVAVDEAAPAVTITDEVGA
jgi:hypothetical protein